MIAFSKKNIWNIYNVIVLVALILLSIFLVSIGNNSALSQSKETVVSALANTPQAPQPRNLTFYMHNSTIAKDVNGVSTPYIFDTCQSFGKNNTVAKLQDV